jgi:hypothetical protein
MKALPSEESSRWKNSFQHPRYFRAHCLLSERTRRRWCGVPGVVAGRLALCASPPSAYRHDLADCSIFLPSTFISKTTHKSSRSSACSLQHNTVLTITSSLAPRFRESEKIAKKASEHRTHKTRTQEVNGCGSNRLHISIPDRYTRSWETRTGSRSSRSSVRIFTVIRGTRSPKSWAKELMESSGEYQSRVRVGRC